MAFEFEKVYLLINLLNEYAFYEIVGGMVILIVMLFILWGAGSIAVGKRR